MADLKDKLRIGCSGWGYDDWLGGFYPAKTPKSDYLKVYASVFDCVEVDSSFYRTPAPAMVRRWYKGTPDGFLFTAKMPKRITHEKKLKNVDENLHWMSNSFREFKEKLGMVVAQLPPSVKYETHAEAMWTFLDFLDPKMPHAVEFRHKSWFRDDVYGKMRDHKVAVVWTENQYLRSPAVVTADAVYLRLVGDRTIQEFKETQRDRSAETRAWYRELEQSADSVKGAMVFFNNHYAGFGPASVNEFRRLAGLMEYEFPSSRGAGQRGLADFA